MDDSVFMCSQERGWTREIEFWGLVDLVAELLMMHLQPWNLTQLSESNFQELLNRRVDGYPLESIKYDATLLHTESIQRNVLHLNLRYFQILPEVVDINAHKVADAILDLTRNFRQTQSDIIRGGSHITFPKEVKEITAYTQLHLLLSKFLQEG